MRRLMIALAIVAVTACGGGPTEAIDGTAMGPGITISEAIRSDLDGPLLVKGYLVVDATGRVTLSESLAESFPPQPGGATLEVEGLDLTKVEGLVSEDGVSWTEEPVRLLGTVRGGVITVTATAAG